MRHVGRRYYVGPMAFQVMVDLAERDIEVGRDRIDVHMSSVFDGAATEPMQTETGTMQAATPETTTSDLVRIPAAAGYWSNIATVPSRAHGRRC